MRIGVDARHLGAGRGVSRYAQMTLAALTVGHPEDELALLVPGRGAMRVPPELRSDHVRVRRTAAPGRLVFGAGALTGRPRLHRLLGGVLDVLWLPAPAPLGLSGEVPFVVTVHDLSFEERPGDFTRYERLWHRAGRLSEQAHRAAHVVADSAATRDSLVARWGVPVERITVVPPGVAAPPPPAARPTSEVPGRYLLCVGALEPRKAPELLVDAYQRACSAGLDAELVFAGAGRLSKRLVGRPGVHVLGHVGDERLDALYRGALAVVFPSLLEGFGFPPLEGLARGVPAVVADLPVYDETLDGGALRFSSGDAQDLAEALIRVSADQLLRERLVADGRRAVRQLTWERTADGVRRAFEYALDER